MNVELSDLHLECIQFMNKEQLQYYIDDTYEKDEFSNRENPKSVLKVYYAYPNSETANKLIDKVLKKFDTESFFIQTIQFNRVVLFDLTFQQTYFERTIINFKGIAINFKSSESRDYKRQLPRYTERH